MPLLLIAILPAGCKQKEDKKDSDIVAISEAVAEVANLDKEPKMEGRSMSIFLSPKTGK